MSDKLDRACVVIDEALPVIRVTGTAAVYDLDDGSRHVDIKTLQLNGHEVHFWGLSKGLKAQVRELFIETAVDEAKLDQ